MCYRCAPNHVVDVPVCISGIGMVAGTAWAFAHAYEGQPFTETMIPWLIITGIFIMLAVVIGLCIHWMSEP